VRDNVQDGTGTELALRCAERAMGALVAMVQSDGWPGAEPSEHQRSGLTGGWAGAAWALASLGRALDDGALRAAGERAAYRIGVVDESGLLTGAAGVRVARHACGLGVDEPTSMPRGADLGAGAAGVLLAQVRCGADPDPALVRLVARGARPREVGWGWADATDPHEWDPAPQCGVRDGTSGVVLALAEASDGLPLQPIGELIERGLDWEASCLQGRSDVPIGWAHGVAGATAVRLRLAELARGERERHGGGALSAMGERLAREADEGVRRCQEAVDRLTGEAGGDERGVGLGRRERLDGAPGDGLGDCSLGTGVAGLVDALLLAGTAPARGSAERLLEAVVGRHGPDPAAWPGGSGPGLFDGLAGVAVVLARLARPAAAIGSPSLLLP